MRFKTLLSQILLFFIAVSSCFAQAEIEFAENSYDFGKIEEGTIAQHEFLFTNTGDQPLIISAVKASCGCTTPYWTKEPILPGKQGKIKAAYNSKNRPGNFNKSITVTSNAVHSTKMVYIKGSAVKSQNLQPMFTAQQLEQSPKIELDNKSLQLGKVQIKKGHNISFTVQNKGKSPLQLKGLYSSCRCLKIAQGQNWELAPGGQQQIQVTFTPQKIGSFNYEAQLLSNDLLQPRIGFKLSGEAIPANQSSLVNESPSKITF